MPLSLDQCRKIADDNALFGAQAYALARVPGETRSAERIFSVLCFQKALEVLE